MRYTDHRIVFQEIPDEISLAFLISGCQLKCHGCHSWQSWSAHTGQELTASELSKYIQKYQGWVTCVLFLGGEWHENALIEHLQFCQKIKLKTALYTGEDNVSPQIKLHLDFLKTGHFDQKKGGLESRITNQKLIALKTNELLNHHFYK